MTSKALPPSFANLVADRAPIAAVIAVFLLGLAISYPFTVRLESLGVIDQYNILFDTDPNQSLAAISHGWGRNYRHWNLATFFGIPIRIAAKTAATLSGAEEMAIREELGLLVAPLLSAATGPLILGVCLLFGMRLRYAVMVALVNQVCASRVVFGSVPESFPISAFTIAFLLWLTAADMRKEPSNRKLAWVAAGVFGFGVTVTNIVSFCCSWLFSRFNPGTDLLRALYSTARMAVLVVAINALILVISTLFFSEDVTSIVQGASQDPYYSNNLFHSLGELPFSIAHSIAGPRPAVTPESIALRENLPIRTMFQFAQVPRGSPESITYVVFAWTCFVLGAVGWYQAGGQRRRFGGLCVLLVALNSAPHLFYRGADLFLYSQQWQVPLVLIIGGVFFLRSRWGKPGTIVMGVLLCVCAWRSYSLVEFILTTLSGTATSGLS